MGLSVPGDEDGLRYGIHGTNEPDSIGEYASAGCVRLSNSSAEEVYEKVPIGTPVRIIRGSSIHRWVTDWLEMKGGLSTIFIISHYYNIIFRNDCRNSFANRRILST